ncbi:hypothetical protein [Dankookia sp. P2]|uniref:hypothetical protein n=1 Tax=Dankookia sp. P2 TaxID=3423955 RepID=UPI003D664408
MTDRKRNGCTRTSGTSRCGGAGGARYPELYLAYAALGEACAGAGPVEGEALRLVKLALAIAAGRSPV